METELDLDLDLNLDLDLDLDLDFSWLNEIDNNDDYYNRFYCEDIKFLNIFCIYINEKSEIFKINKTKHNLLQANTLLKEELLHIIKNNIVNNNIKYSLFSILKYNIDIEPSNIKILLTNKDSLLLGNNFLHTIKNIDTIVFEKSISFFHKLNNLIIIFKKTNNNSKMGINKCITKKKDLKFNLKKTKKQKN